MQAQLRDEFIYQEILEQEDIARRILAVAPRPWPAAPGRAWITGAGDCLAAAQLLSAVLPERRLRALPAMEASAGARELGPDDLLIALSVSGRTPRVVEAAGRARRAGARVVAVTDDPGAPLAGQATEIWPIGASPLAALQRSGYATQEARGYVGYHHDVAQTKTFLASVLTVAHAAGPVARDLPERVGGLTSARFVEPLGRVAEELAAAGAAFFLGRGAGAALARFAAYKLFEFNRVAHFSDPEEYCHTLYFVTRPGDAVVFLADDPATARRAGEVAPVLADLFGARTVCVRTADLAPWEGPGEEIVVPGGGSELERAVGSTLAVQWLTYLWGRIGAPDVNTFHAGYDTERLVAASMRTIRRSRIEF